MSKYAILRRYLTNSSPLVEGFPCMSYTITEKEYEKTRDSIGTTNANECLELLDLTGGKSPTRTISCCKFK